MGGAETIRVKEIRTGRVKTIPGEEEGATTNPFV